MSNCTKFARNDQVVFTDKVKVVKPGSTGVVIGSIQGFYQVFAAEVNRVVNVRGSDIKLLEEESAPTLPTAFGGPEPVEAEPKRKERRGPANARKTRCPHGHPYSGDNLYVTPRGHRECVTCRKTRPKKDEDVAAEQAAIVEGAPADREPEAEPQTTNGWMLGAEAVVTVGPHIERCVEVVGFGKDDQVIVELPTGELSMVRAGHLARPVFKRIEEEGKKASRSVLGAHTDDYAQQVFAKGYSKALRDVALDREPAVNFLEELKA